MRAAFSRWLIAEGHVGHSNRFSNAARVERHLGDLDAMYDADRLAGVLNALAYSTDDQRRGRANPTSIPIQGDLRTNLASYAAAVRLYRRFREHEAEGLEPVAAPTAPVARAAVSVPARRVPPRAAGATSRALIPAEHARTLEDFALDGRAALTELLRSSRYGGVASAVAALTGFSHPDTVSQTGGAAIFPAIRGRDNKHTIVEHEGARVMLDDNRLATDAFRWANGLRGRGRDMQFNHVYPRRHDPACFTALPNLCMTPSFLTKLTDHEPEVSDLLAYRSFDLYGWVPPGCDPPPRPPGYAALSWAPPLAPVADVRRTLQAALASKSKHPAAILAREVGWLFDGAVDG